MKQQVEGTPQLKNLWPPCSLVTSHPFFKRSFGKVLGTNIVLVEVYILLLQYNVHQGFLVLYLYFYFVFLSFLFITRRPFWSPWGIKALSLHCLCPISLTLNEKLDLQNLIYEH